jgi:hypothetical protein
MRYRDQIKEARKWSYVEAGFSEELSAEDRLKALEKADQLFEEAKKEIEEIEAEEEENYARHDRKYKRHFDNAA